MITKRYFGSMDELAVYIEANNPGDRTCASRRKRNPWGGGDWYGGLSYEAALTALREGQPISTSELDSARARIKLRTVETIDTELAVSGAVPDVATYLTGQPECMIAFAPVEKPVRTITIAYNVSANCEIASEVLYARGAAITAIVDSLETRGIRCKLIAYEAVNNRYFIGVLVKQHDQPLDLSRVAFTAHPSYLRRIMFAAEECEPDEIRREHGFREGYGYGYPTAAPKECLTIYEIDYIIPHCEVYKPAQAVSQVFNAFPVELINDVTPTYER